MTARTRTVSWGEGIVVAAFRYGGGLKVAVDQIQAFMGSHIGTRNTFAKLLRVDDPATLNTKDQLRAWLLLTTLGENPEEWGINDGVVPRSVDLDVARLVLGTTEPRPAEPNGADVRPEGFEPPTFWSVAIGSVTRDNVIDLATRQRRRATSHSVALVDRVA